MLLNLWKKIRKGQFVLRFQNKMIGLFLGDTDFSEIVLKKIKKRKIKYFILDFSKKNKFKRDMNSSRISIGKFGEIINLIKKKNVKEFCSQVKF